VSRYTSAILHERLNDLNYLRARYTVAGAPTLVSGPFGPALEFDGAADYITLNNLEYSLRFNAGTQDFSISCWIKRNATGTAHCIMSKLDSLNDGWIFSISDITDKIYFKIDTIFILGSTAIDTDWHHVAVIVDRSGNMQVYLDGVADSTPVAVSGEVMSTITTPRIGANTIGPLNHFNGQISNLIVIDRILSTQEIDDLAHNKVFDYLKNLISHWTGVNAPTIISGVAGSKALEFDGDDAHVNVGDVLELNAVEKFGICFWMNQDVLGTPDNIFRKSIDNDNRIVVYTVAGNFIFGVSNNGAAYGKFDASTVMASKQWHHVAAMFDGSLTGNVERLKVYVDGQQITLNFDGTTIPAATVDLSGIDLIIGYSGASFDGKLDKCMLFNQPLTNLQVVDLMNMTKQGRF
jgi:hypothetical protein